MSLAVADRALVDAVDRGDAVALAAALAAGASADARDPLSGLPSLMMAAGRAMWFNNVGVVEYLLSLDTGLNLKTSYGFTIHDHLAYALKVNQSGADQSARSRSFWTAGLRRTTSASPPRPSWPRRWRGTWRRPNASSRPEPTSTSGPPS